MNNRNSLERPRSARSLAGGLGLVKCSVTAIALQQGASRALPKIRLPRKGGDPLSQQVLQQGAGRYTVAPLDALGDRSRAGAMQDIRNQLTAAGEVLPPSVAAENAFTSPRLLSTRRQASAGVDRVVNPPLKQLGLPTIPTPRTGEGQRALNALVHAHEAAEAAAFRLPRTTHLNTHADPSVITKEHQMLSRLVGPGAEEGTRYVKALRAHAEAPIFANVVRTITGGRGGYHEYGSKKLPKALRKRVEERWRDLLEGEARNAVTQGQLPESTARALGYIR